MTLAPEAAFEKYFHGPDVPYGLTSLTWTYALYTLTLPKDPRNHEYKFELDPDFVSMVNVLPPVYNATTKPVFDAAMSYWGSAFTVGVHNGGMVEYLGSWRNW